MKGLNARQDHVARSEEKGEADLEVEIGDVAEVEVAARTEIETKDHLKR